MATQITANGTPDVYEDAYNIWVYLGKAVYRHYVKSINEYHYDTECDHIFYHIGDAREHVKSCPECQMAIKQEVSN